jgi:predicted patatin/cPLA2 family phospholipase
MHKAAIICIGGGMRSAHGAGFLYALANHLHITDPNLVIASSGSAGGVLYFATQKQEQSEASKYIWTELLATPRFISFFRPWRIMDIDYLIDGIFKDKAPLDVDALAASSIDYVIPVVAASSGQIVYMGKKDKVDPFELLRATKALPFFYRKRVTLKNEEFTDGTLGNTLQNYIDTAIKLGAQKILLIDDSSNKTLIRKSVAILSTLFLSRSLSRNIRRSIFAKEFVMPAGVQYLYIHRAKLPIGVLGRNKRKLQETFQTGVQDALDSKENLFALFSKVPTSSQTPNKQV